MRNFEAGEGGFIHQNSGHGSVARIEVVKNGRQAVQVIYRVVSTVWMPGSKSKSEGEEIPLRTLLGSRHVTQGIRVNLASQTGVERVATALDEPALLVVELLLQGKFEDANELILESLAVLHA